MARPPFTFDRNTLGSNGSFLLRFIAGRPFARAAHLKNAGHFTASLQEGQSACRSAVQGSRPHLGIDSKSDQIAVCRAFDIWRCRRPMGPLPPVDSRLPGLFAAGTVPATHLTLWVLSPAPQQS